MKSLVIMPFYNEGKISKIYSEEIISTFVQSSDFQFDFLLVDDDSSDNTYKMLKEVSNLHANVILKKNKNNYGHGKTVVESYQYAVENQYKIAIQIDGDNAGEPESILKMIKYALEKNLDLCLATRMKRPDNIIRKIITKILYLNLFFLYGVKSNDSNVGIRFMKVSFLQKINLNYLKTLLIPNACITAIAYCKKFKVSNYPVTMRNNLRAQRSGEQWGSGNSIKSVFKLLKGSVKCLMEVNIDFRKIM